MPVRMLPVCASAVRALQENVSVGEEKNTRFALHRAVPLYRVLPKLSPMVKELPPVTAAQQQRFLLEGMAPYRKKDAYGAYTICNIYYDTGDWRLIRKSLEKTVYKEKLRIRSYGVPTGDDKVFVELKKKYDGVVYKRRIAMIAARRFFKSGRLIFSNRSERRPHRYERELSCRQPPGDGDAAVPGAGTGAVGGKRRRRCFCDCTISA